MLQGYPIHLPFIDFSRRQKDPECPKSRPVYVSLAQFHANCLVGYRAFADASGKEVSCPSCGGDPDKVHIFTQRT
eukprot:685549-Amorphochlora_amoeboformis.AAC.1